MYNRIAQDNGIIEFDSSIPPLGSKDNPIEISNKEYINLDNPEFIGQTPVNSLNEYTMVFKNKGLYYKTINIL